MQELTYSLAPDDWALCFHHDCPLAEACLRHAVGLLAPPSLTRHAIVMPGARQGGQCCLFASKEPGIDREPDYDTATLEYYFP